jgi:hypothetical protein
VPAFLIAFDPTTGLFRIAHARPLDVAVQLVYLRLCDIKAQLAHILTLEAQVEAQLSPEWGQALAGGESTRFLLE